MIILCLIILSIVCGWVSIKFIDNDHEGFGIVFGMVATVFIMFTVVCLIGIVVSYSSYLDMRAFYDVTVDQYRESIEIYQDLAVIKINDKAMTDIKYQGYQEAIAKQFQDLKTNVIKYNTNFIKKQKMGKVLWLKFMIIQPDEDMKILRLKESRQLCAKCGKE